MIVGVISKPEHAKSVISAIKGNGHDVVMLGARPTVVPTRVQAIVCRIVSASHGGVDLAQSIKRDGKIPVIFEDSVTRTIEALNEIEHLNERLAKPQSNKAYQPTSTKPAAIPPVVQMHAVKPAPAPAPAPPVSAPTTVRPAQIRQQLITRVASILGWFSVELVRRLTPNEIMSAVGAEERKDPTAGICFGAPTLRLELKALLTHLAGHPLRQTGAESRVIFDNLKEYTPTRMYFINQKNVAYETLLWTSVHGPHAEPKNKAHIANALGLQLTRDQHALASLPQNSSAKHSTVVAADNEAKILHLLRHAPDTGLLAAELKRDGSFKHDTSVFSAVNRLIAKGVVKRHSVLKRNYVLTAAQINTGEETAIRSTSEGKAELLRPSIQKVLDRKRELIGFVREAGTTGIGFSRLQAKMHIGSNSAMVGALSHLLEAGELKKNGAPGFQRWCTPENFGLTEKPEEQHLLEGEKQADQEKPVVTPLMVLGDPVLRRSENENVAALAPQAAPVAVPVAPVVTATAPPEVLSTKTADEIRLDELRTLESMTREVMAKHGLTEWSVSSTGKAKFKRVVITHVEGDVE